MPPIRLDATPAWVLQLNKKPRTGCDRAGERVARSVGRSNRVQLFLFRRHRMIGYIGCVDHDLAVDDLDGGEYLILQDVQDADVAGGCRS